MKIRTKKRIFPYDTNDHSVIIVNNERKKFGIFHNGSHSKTHKFGGAKNTIENDPNQRDVIEKHPNENNATRSDLDEKSITLIPISETNLNSSFIVCKRESSCGKILPNLGIVTKKNTQKDFCNALPKLATTESQHDGWIRGYIYPRILPVESMTETSVLKLLSSSSDLLISSVELFQDDWSFSEHSQLSSLSE